MELVRFQNLSSLPKILSCKSTEKKDAKRDYFGLEKGIYILLQCCSVSGVVTAQEYKVGSV